MIFELRKISNLTEGGLFLKKSDLVKIKVAYIGLANTPVKQNNWSNIILEIRNWIKTYFIDASFVG